MRRLITCLFAVMSIATYMSGSSFALDIKQVDWKGQRVLFASGEIVQAHQGIEWVILALQSAGSMHVRILSRRYS
jgi:hypothetical protein